MEPTLQLVEGALDWWINLTGNLGDEPGTHALNGSWAVGSPPLPVLEGALISDSDDVEAGETLTLHLQVWNNGTVDYSGGLSCFEDGVVALNISDASIAPGVSHNWTFERSAKPMMVECETMDARIDPGSNFPVALNIAMPSAVFESAGSTTPTLSATVAGAIRSPLIFSFLTRALDGRVRLVLSLVQRSLKAVGWN